MINYKVIIVIITLVEFVYSQEDICLLPFKVGMCRKLSTRFYFDGQVCQVFNGCPLALNANNFEFMNDCLERCEQYSEDVCSIPFRKSKCRKLGTRYFFDGQTCIQFRGCPIALNGNSFKSRDECLDRCGPTDD